jgi:MFS family permease
MGSFVVTPLLLLTTFGYSATATSFLTMIRALTGAVMSPMAGRITPRVGERRTAVAASVGMAGSMAVCAVGAGSGRIAVLVAGMIVSSVALNHVTPAALAVVANAVDDNQLGLATSAQQTMTAIGGVVGLSVMTGVAADSVGTGPFVGAYLLAAGAALVGAALATRIVGEGPHGREQPPHPEVDLVTEGM